MAPVSVVAAVTAVTAAAIAIAAVHGEDLRNVIITGFGELPYEPAPGWRPGGFYQSDVFPVDVNGNGGLPQTMDVALRTSIMVVDPNENKSSFDGTENNSAEDVVKSSSKNRQVSEKNNSLDQDKAKEIEEELLSARTRSGLRKLKGQRDTQEKSNLNPSFPSSSDSQYRQAENVYPFYNPFEANGYNNREYYGDLGEGWNLEDAEEILGGKNYNILTQAPNGYRPKSYNPPTPPTREVPPPRFPPSSFNPFPGHGYKPFPPPPGYGPVGHPTSGRGSRVGYYRSEGLPRSRSRPPSKLREEVVYGPPIDSDYQPSERRGSLVPRVYPYYDDYLRGA